MVGTSYTPQTIARIDLSQGDLYASNSYKSLNSTFNPENGEHRDFVGAGVFLFGGLIGLLIGLGIGYGSKNQALNQEAQRRLDKKSASLRHNPNNSRELETELRDIKFGYVKEKVAKLYNNGLPKGPGGGVPRKTGPHGLGGGPGGGRGDGTGWEAMLQWVQTPEGIIWLKTQEGQEWIRGTGAVSNYNKSEECIKDYDPETKEGIKNNEKSGRLGKTVEDKKDSKEMDLEERVKNPEGEHATKAEKGNYADKSIDGDYEPIEKDAEVAETEESPDSEAPSEGEE